MTAPSCPRPFDDLCTSQTPCPPCPRYDDLVSLGTPLYDDTPEPEDAPGGPLLSGGGPDQPDPCGGSGVMFAWLPHGDRRRARRVECPVCWRAS